MTVVISFTPNMVVRDSTASKSISGDTHALEISAQATFAMLDASALFSSRHFLISSIDVGSFGSLCIKEPAGNSSSISPPTDLGKSVLGGLTFKIDRGSQGSLIGDEAIGDLSTLLENKTFLSDPVWLPFLS
ncbi:hypothetical protein OGATHE_004619 [Ogataea polymorpha]|uniref:Uncharacterized protein n=1 Tax=Ogataea polymorpha TaxID=460523 RepID=A0A9P8NZZ4_9ASCO|nr:hypothetical protein OGATHE_004619 [Ogataea polymorpha]